MEWGSDAATQTFKRVGPSHARVATSDKLTAGMRGGALQNSNELSSCLKASHTYQIAGVLKFSRADRCAHSCGIAGHFTPGLLEGREVTTVQSSLDSLLNDYGPR